VRIDCAHVHAVDTFTSACRRHLRAAFFAVGACGSILVGCASESSQQDTPALSSKPLIPLPQRTLLAQQPEPNCVLKISELRRGEVRVMEREKASTSVANLSIDQGSGRAIGSEILPPSAGATPQRLPTLAQSDPDAGLGQRIKLEHERNCYQQAEMRARERLLLLQKAVRKTIAVVKRIEQNDR
jgi:hypothetical protein